jgi:formylglycine-generating enzyme required for sulfatase activity
MIGWPQAVVILIMIFFAIGCTYDAQYADCTIHCTADSGCPDDLVCLSDGFCRSPGVVSACSSTSEVSPSCDGLPKTCGPSGDEDCCSTAETIPGGTFYRSYDTASDGMYSTMSYPATVSAFKLDRFEVTVGRFRKFVEAGMGTQANAPLAGTGGRYLNATPNQAGWEYSWTTALQNTSNNLVAALKCDNTHQTWTDVAGANEDLAVNCVSWFEAAAFCLWDGGFLPTETEWNFAASGGEQQRAYPWSGPADSLDIDCTRANYNKNYPVGFCTNGSTGAVVPAGSESPSGDGRWGHADLGGNINEWTLDAHDNYQGACDGCADLNDNGSRVVRGSDWANAADTLRSAFRNYTAPDTRDPKVGIRCARPLH